MPTVTQEFYADLWTQFVFYFLVLGEKPKIGLHELLYVIISKILLNAYLTAHL